MKGKGITIQVIPYAQIAYLSSYKRVKQLVELAAANKILLVQGKLDPQEEADLIEETMKKIQKGKGFKGIELATFEPKPTQLPFFSSLKESLIKTIVGNRNVLTVIGPASLVREIKKDPTKIELLLRK